MGLAFVPRRGFLTKKTPKFFFTFFFLTVCVISTCTLLTRHHHHYHQVTKSSYTGEEDFSAADQVTEDLVEDGEASAAVTLATLTAIVKDRAGVAS